MAKKKYKVHIGEDKPFIIKADFLHIKEGVPCLYIKDGHDLPDVVFALTAPGYIKESRPGDYDYDD